MRIIFHGQLRKLYGESFDILAETVAEAVRGFSIQAKDWPSQMRISVVRHDTIEKLYESPQEIHLMPALAGGGGKFGQIILGAALIALAFIPGGQAAWAVGTAMHGSLIVAGSVMILQGVMQLFMKTPKIKKSEDPEASKYLSVNKNTTAIGTPITAAWGRIDLAGHWLSLQSDSDNLSFGVFPSDPSAISGIFDFTSGEELPDGVTVTRSTPGSRFNSSGNLVLEDENVARFTYNKDTLALEGLLVEPASENHFYNSVLAGGVVGVVGSGGALPTGLTFPNSRGINPEIVAISTINGMEYVDIKFAGTPNNTGPVTLGESSAPASSGDVINNSIYIALISGSFTNVTGHQLRAGSNGTGATNWSTVTSTLKRYENSRAISDTNSSLTLRWNYVNTTTPVDFTLRIAAPQREINSGTPLATSLIPTSGSGLTRDADLVVLNWNVFNVADGIHDIKYTFDNNSTQIVSTLISSGYSTVPTNLNRPIIKKIERI